jgi:hypothetical protein
MHNDSLSLMALKYAAGDLRPADVAAFELKLTDDPAARDALEQAIRLSAAAIGQPEFLPDPLFRSAITEQLRSAPSMTSRFFARRPYRGHPLAWTMAGAGASAATALGLWFGSPTPPVDCCPAISNSSAVAVNPVAIPIVPATIPANPLVDAVPMGETVGTTNGGNRALEQSRPDTSLPGFPKLELPMGPPSDG